LSAFADNDGAAMTHFLHTEDDLRDGLAQLIVIDPRLSPVAEKAGIFKLRRREGGYPGLCAIVCGQQLSVTSAAAIRDRLFKALDPFHHDAVRKARPDKLKRLGLSNNKIKAIKEIGKAVAANHIDLDAVGNMDADVAHEALVALHGVGPWTADIYLLFCLGHADAFPAGDLAVQEAARIALNLRKRPDAKALTKIAEAWRPWRGVAAHLMWAYYHVVKKREGISVETKQLKIKSKVKNKAKKKPAVQKRATKKPKLKKSKSKTSNGVSRAA
jgi:DNA-3-methyladenine glycosylase II